MRRGVIAAMVAGSMGGGALGATVLSAASSSAATTSTTPSSTQSPSGYGAGPQSGGVFHSNENPGHEKTESAQREAQETAGQFPTVP
jgi:hypothetical protein